MNKKKSYFRSNEFACKCCGQGDVTQELRDKLNEARALAKTPFIINSGFRCDKYEVDPAP